MKHNTNCSEIRMLIDDYLEGMISTSSKEMMEKHLKDCEECKNYLEDTLVLLEKAALMSFDDEKAGRLLTKNKQQQMWLNIESKINQNLHSTNTHAYNINDLEEEYISDIINENNIKGNLQIKQSSWQNFRFFFSGLAAILILAFIFYGVNKFMKLKNTIDPNSNIIEVSGGPKWMVTSIMGNPMINNLVMKAVDSLGIGGIITTNDSSKAELYVAGLGSVIIEPNSRVKLTKSVTDEHRIQLDYGVIDANINAKPRTFFVDAGTVTAVDLGCSYKFSIDKSGDGLLYVKQGKVSLQSASGRESLVPEGKFCVTKQNIGPGTPFREDSSPKLKKALMEFDFGICGGQCIKTILANSKQTDAVTLVNILPRVEEKYRRQVYQKVYSYCPPPRNIPEDSIPKLNRVEDIYDWVDKIMEQVNVQIQENMAKIEENVKKFDNEKWQKDWQNEWQKNWDENFKNNPNFKYELPPGTDSLQFFYNNQAHEWTPEEREEFEEDMKEMQEELKIDNEEFKKEMEEIKEELKKVNEKIKKDMDEVKKEAEHNKHEQSEETKKQKRESEKEKKPSDTGDDDNE